MDSDIFDTNEHVAEHYVLSLLSSSLSCGTVGYMNRIKFASDILTYPVRNKGNKRCHHKIVQWKNKGLFDILNDVSDHVTLFQQEDSAGNVNHSVSIKRC